MIRELRKEDYPMIDLCMQKLHEQHVNGRPDLYAPMEHPYSEEEFTEIIEDGKHIAIAEVDEEDTILGFCIALLKNKSGMIENMKTAYVDEIFVRREYRRKGIARKLFEEMEQRAKEYGVERVDLMVWGFNESALELYKSLGMSPQRYIMEKHL